MPDEVAEQTAPVITGAEEAVIEAPAGALDETVEPASGDPEAVAEAPVTFDFSTDAGILAALEANPNLKGFLTKREADAANTARQRRDAELRRDQGANERAQQYHEWLVTELEKGTDPRELARQTPTWVKANEDFTRTELMKALLRQAGEFDETAKGLADTLEGSPDELTKVAQVTLDSAVRRAREESRSSTLASLTFDALPDDHPLRSYLRDQIAAGVKAELEAQAKEQVIAVNPPNVQGFGPGSISTTDPLRERAMTTGIPIADETSRKQLAALLGVPL